jgi:hypothetical protein
LRAEDSRAEEVPIPSGRPRCLTLRWQARMGLGADTPRRARVFPNRPRTRSAVSYGTRP